MKKNSTSLRWQQMLQMLAGRDEVSVAEFAECFQVTTMTIRRDLDSLEQQGRITRTHGGAILAAPAVVAFAFQSRRQSHMDAKRAIALEAASRVEEGMTVFMDTGTTTLEVAKALAGVANLKVLTSSLAIASALLAHEGLELVLLGGTVNRGSPDLSGPLTEDNLEKFRADLAIIGADALDERGLYTASQQIASVSQSMMNNARRTLLVADSSKFGEPAFVRFSSWSQVDEVITDEGLNISCRQWISEKKSELTMVSI